MPRTSYLALRALQGWGKSRAFQSVRRHRHHRQPDIIDTINLQRKTGCTQIVNGKPQFDIGILQLMISRPTTCS